MKTRHFLKLQGSALALVLCGMAVAATASAQQAAGADAAPAFQSIDKNGDGHLMRSEIPSDMTLLRSRFPTYDADHNQSLDVREYAAAEAALNGGGNAEGSDSTAPSPRRDSTSGH